MTEIEKLEKAKNDFAAMIDKTESEYLGLINAATDAAADLDDTSANKLFSQAEKLRLVLDRDRAVLIKMQDRLIAAIAAQIAANTKSEIETASKQAENFQKNMKKSLTNFVAAWNEIYAYRNPSSHVDGHLIDGAKFLYRQILQALNQSTKSANPLDAAALIAIAEKNANDFAAMTENRLLKN